jgi:tRNA pseudouridine32 synthase / 23S rRNA pseudouridine746 synthase
VASLALLTVLGFPPSQKCTPTIPVAIKITNISQIFFLIALTLTSFYTSLVNYIVHESKDLVVIDKPAGVLSVPSRFGTKDERPIAASLIPQVEIKSLYPVHRLDFEVSGLLVFAKNSNTQRILSGEFESRRVKKSYIALSEDKSLAPFEFNKTVTWKNLLVKGKKRVFEAPYGKNAITHAEPVRKFKSYILWNLYPETGRPHQLRFHMAKAGFPIAGDKKYGSRQNFVKDDIALRAVELEFLDKNIVNGLDIPRVFRVTLREDYWQHVL